MAATNPLTNGHSIICGDHGGTNHRGEPCKKPCPPGATRCVFHGYGIASKLKAEQALAQARIPACSALFEIVDQFLQNTCPHCNYPSGDNESQRAVIRAAQVILDRTQMGPHSTIEVTKQSDGDLNLKLLTQDERGQLQAHIAQINFIKDAVRRRALMQGALSEDEIRESAEANERKALEESDAAGTTH